MSLGQLRRRLLAALLLLNALVLGLSAYSLWRDHQQYEQRVVVSTQNLAQLVQRDVEAVFRRIDDVLRLLADELHGEVGVPTPRSQYLNEQLRLHQTYLPEVISLRLTDARGRVQHGAEVVPGAVDLSDRPFFQRLREDPQAGMVIGKPVLARISKVWSIPIARRLNTADGRFAGILYANLPVKYLVSLFAGLDLGPHGTVVLRNLDYELLARFPALTREGEGLGEVAVSAELLSLLSSGLPHGTYHAVAPTDRIERVHTFYRLSEYPLYVIVGQSPRDYLASWHKNVWETLALTLLFGLTSVVLAVFLDRNWRRQLRMTELLRDSEQRWSLALESGDFAVWDWDMVSGKVELSKRGKALLGYGDDEVGDTMADWERLTHPDDLPRLRAIQKDHFRQRTPNFTAEFRMRAKDGGWRWLLSRGMVVDRAPDGKPLRMIGTQVDLSERRQREEELQLSATVFQIADEAMVVTSPDNRIVSVNPAFTRITGYAAEEVIGHNPRMLSAGMHDRAFYEVMWRAIVEQGGWAGEVLNRRKNGEVYVEWLSIRRLSGENGELLRHVAVFSDITVRKAEEERLQHLALHDALTDLPNRPLLTERLEQSIVRAQREKARVGLIYFDLDKFKPVNDNHGHEVGDQILREVAERVLDCVRASDTVARLGGDEFVVLLPTVDGGAEAMMVAEKIRQALNRPFEVAGLVLEIGCSLGVAMYPDHGENAVGLMRHADAAMYEAKKEGRNRVVLFRPDM